MSIHGRGWGVKGGWPSLWGVVVVVDGWFLVVVRDISIKRGVCVHRPGGSRKRIKGD